MKIYCEKCDKYTEYTNKKCSKCGFTIEDEGDE